MLANSSRTICSFPDFYNQQFAFGESPIDERKSCVFFGSGGQGRAYLTREMVRELLPLLQEFADTGHLQKKTPPVLQTKAEEEETVEQIRLVPRRKATLHPIDRYKPESSATTSSANKGRKRDFHQFVFGVSPDANRNKRKFDVHIRDDDSASKKPIGAAGPLKVVRKRKISSAQSRAFALK